MDPYGFRNKRSETEAVTAEIITALTAELSETPYCIDFKVLKKQFIGRVLVLELQESTKAKLEEAFEEAHCNWDIIKDNRKTSADGASADTGKIETIRVEGEILSVLLDKGKVNVHHLTGEAPKEGDIVKIYPPKYLYKLRDLWETRSLASSFLCKRYDHNNNVYNSHDALDTQGFPMLRVNQRKAFELPAYKASFLWGPPGTGKTFTLGAMIAQYVLQFPDRKVLLLSTTNTAIDQALIAVDKALEMIKTKENTMHVREKCIRLGKNFTASMYEERSHLLPTEDTELLNQLVELEMNKPDKEDVIEYAKWKDTHKSLKDAIKVQTMELLRKSRLVAATTTFAIWAFGSLEEVYFDFVVFDEVSQVSIVHSLPLAYLGNKVMYAGDFKQLSPVVKSNIECAKRWLGLTAFKDAGNQEEEHFCKLNEQSRMHFSVCELVSRLFYDNFLQVSEDAKNDPKWLDVRSSLTNYKPVNIIKAPEDSQWSHNYNGPIRFSSAQQIVETVQDIISEVKEKDVLVLTPFHAQRVLITQLLRRQKIKNVDVSTIHKSQGSERLVVFVDPVVANTPFFTREPKFFEQIMNVAFSRAQGYLFFYYSEDDLQNELITRILTVEQWMYNPPDVYGTLQHFVKTGTIDYQVMGKIVSYNDVNLYVTGIDHKELTAVDCKTGRIVKYSTSILMKKLG